MGATRFIDLDLRNRTVEIGNTWLGEAARGTRINAEAKLLQLTYAFETLNLNRVALKTHHENLQSQNAMKAIGAIYEGTFRNHYLMPDGTHRHTLLPRDQWTALIPDAHAGYIESGHTCAPCSTRRISTLSSRTRYAAMYGVF